MRRITEHEAKTFIPLKEKNRNTGVENDACITIKHSERGEGWEKEKYFTEKK